MTYAELCIYHLFVWSLLLLLLLLLLLVVVVVVVFANFKTKISITVTILFHNGHSSFTGGWLTASLLKSPELFSVFWPILVMLYFGWSRFVLRFSTFLAPFPSLYGLFQVHQSQLVSRWTSCSIAFLVLWQGPSTFPSTSFLLFPLCGPLVRQSLLYVMFSFFFSSLGLVFRSGKGNLFVSQSPKKFYASHFPGRILVWAFTNW